MIHFFSVFIKEKLAEDVYLRVCRSIPGSIEEMCIISPHCGNSEGGITIRKHQVEARSLSPIRHMTNSRLSNIEKISKVIAKRTQPGTRSKCPALIAFAIFLFSFFDWFVLLIGLLTCAPGISEEIDSQTNQSPRGDPRVPGFLTDISPLLHVSKNYPSPRNHNDARSFSSCFSTHLLGGFSTRGSMICKDGHSYCPLITLRGISERNRTQTNQSPRGDPRVPGLFTAISP